MREVDVVILGAGPAGSVAAALLIQQGLKVTVLEKAVFPRFSIGESLLPQAMVFLEEAGLTEAVTAAGFQLKDGAAFALGDAYTEFPFQQKFSQGPGTTFQVTRADFDSLLANTVAEMGAAVLYSHEVTSVAFDSDAAFIHGTEPNGEFHFKARFVLDASGFGRVLPRLLQLDRPSQFPKRFSLFTHVKDAIDPEAYDRNKILISVHPEQRDIWYWLIPFSNGTSSVGVVYPSQPEGSDPEAQIQATISSAQLMSSLLKDAEYHMPVSSLSGYSATVSQLYGDRFALLGNAAEFLDPVFSSGVTIAMKSASLAANVVARQLKGESVDWEQEFAIPLKEGVNVFRKFVQSWYDGGLQDIIFSQQQDAKVRGMICSILAGYVWDKSNPYVSNYNRLDTLARLCAKG